DANNCINTTLITITNTNGATVTATGTNTTCGNSNGSIIATGTGGVAPYEYSIDGVNFQVSNIFNGIAAGAYTVTIRDANNCTNTTPVIITNTNGATVTATGTNTTCGNSNGSIIATGTGGVTPYQYSIDGVNFQVSNIFNGIAAGTYTITIRDANNCTSTTPVIITNANGATVTATGTNTTCGNNNGSIIATGTGGIIPYQYSIDGGVIYQASNTFSNLGAGIYTVTIKDANNCVNTSTPVTITNSIGATVTATATNTTCGNSNGSITATGAGGTIPYQYSIDGVNFQVSNIFTGIVAGTYTVTIRDANHCTNTISVTVANTNGATVTATSSNTTCGNNNGSITATGTGGTIPYQYSIDAVNFQISNIFNGIAAGIYIVTIRDANNCTNSISVTVANTSGATVTATSSNTSCGNNNGVITATGVGGAAPYQYSIDGVNFQASNIFNGIAAGTYTITIKDANNCINTSSPVIITISNPVTVNAGNDITLCEGASRQFTAISNAAQFSWSPSTGLSNPFILNPVVSPATTTTYVLTATNGQCSQTDTITVLVNAAPIAHAGADQLLCFGKNTQLNGSGGSVYQWTPPINLSDPTIANPAVQSPGAGTWIYSLKVIDGNGCPSKTNDTVVITVRPPVKVFAGRDTSVTINQPLQLNAVDISNSGIIAYKWSPPFGLNNPFIQNPVAILDRSTTYIVTATTAEGCEGSDDIIVKVFLQPELYVPTAFTPNGDGLNDILKVIPVGIKELKYFSIYSRWGELVFTTKDAEVGWNGIFNGKEQSSNVFVWKAEGIDYNGNIIFRKGTVTLIR
ncbi:MAG: gliding motility-associated C-terminal domain-containing protein, partial [Bacteroidota bacterium]|nr:gliding motility-associated C-terminal domain-containing protein [Bacteroidota bacterium]